MGDIKIEGIRVRKNVNGKSGAQTTISLEGNLQSTKNEGIFTWVGLGGPMEFSAKKGVVKKINIDKETADLEQYVNDRFRDLGYSVMEIKRVNDTELEIQYIPGLTLLEELMLDRTIDAEDKIISKLKDKYQVSQNMNSDLNSKILGEDKKRFIKNKVVNSLIEAGIDGEYAENYPMTSKIRVRLNNNEFIESGEKRTLYDFLETLERMLKPLYEKFAQFSQDSYGENFIGEHKIDLNGFAYGIMDQAKILDTPYMLSDLFWIQRLHEPNLSQYRRIESKKYTMVCEEAKNNNIDSFEAAQAYQGARVFSNLLLFLHNYEDAKKHGALKGMDTEFKTFKHSNQMFAHYEMSDTGANSFIGNYQDRNSADYKKYISTLKDYKHIMDKLCKSAFQEIFPDQELLDNSFRAFKLVRLDYNNYKNSSPQGWF